MRGNCSPTSMSTIRRPPNTVRIVTRPGSPECDPSDDCRALPERMGAQRRERGVRLVRRHDHDDLALVGEIERVEAENLAECLDLFADRRRALVDLDCRLCDASAISLRTVASPPRVASRMKRTPGAAASSAAISPCSGAQSLSIGVSSAMSPRAHRIAAPWSPSRPLTSTASPGRARSAPRSTPSRITPMPVVVRKSLSQAPLCTTLVSPVTMATPASRAVAAIEAAICAQQVDRHALLDDRGAGEIERDCAADREVVDRAADRELADVAAGKEQRIDDEGIGGEGKPVAAPREIGEIEPRLILERSEQRIVEGRDEHVVDQVLHRLAAAAMGERHRRRTEPGRGVRARTGAATFMRRPP